MDPFASGESEQEEQEFAESNESTRHSPNLGRQISEVEFTGGGASASASGGAPTSLIRNFGDDPFVSHRQESEAAARRRRTSQARAETEAAILERGEVSTAYRSNPYFNARIIEAEQWLDYTTWLVDIAPSKFAQGIDTTVKEATCIVQEVKRQASEYETADAVSHIKHPARGHREKLAKMVRALQVTGERIRKDLQSERFCIGDRDVKARQPTGEGLPDALAKSVANMLAGVAGDEVSKLTRTARFPQDRELYYSAQAIEASLSIDAEEMAAKAATLLRHLEA